MAKHKMVDNVIHDFMHNETRCRDIERDLQRWKGKPREVRLATAHLTALHTVYIEKDDPFAYARRKNHLLNNVAAPEEFQMIMSSNHKGNLHMALSAWRDKVKEAPSA